MSGQFTLLWGTILRSSLWVVESKETRLVWITLLAMKDADGKVYSSVIGLADAAKVSVDECREALMRLMAPDPEDTSKVEEGRRIREISGGWEIINHDRYRFSTSAKREYWREKKAEQRQRKKKQDRPALLPGQSAYLAAEKRGASQEELDRIQTGALPT